MIQLENTIANAVVLILIVLLIAFVIVETFIHRRKERIATLLTLAERDLNNLLNSALEHGGRKGKVVERRDWVQTFLPPTPATPVPVYGSIPSYGNFGTRDNFLSAAQELITANEKDLASKGTSSGKAGVTAFLLRELYEANVRAAQSKIFTETLNNDGTPPYIAPGIYELVGFAKFDKQTGFPPGAGVEAWLLERVVRERAYPRDIQIIKTDPVTGVKTRLEGYAVLRDLLQQNM